MSSKFRTGLSLLRSRDGTSRLSTGYADLDSLLGGGIEHGQFYLFYGDDRSGLDLLLNQILVNCLLPEEKNGFGGKAVYSNCGNYRREKTMLDSSLISSLLKSAGLNPGEALDDIYVICTFSEEQQEGTVNEIQRLLDNDKEIKIVVVHNITRLFFSATGLARENFGRKIIGFQKVVLKLWQACAQRNVALVASCRPSSRGLIPLPEGGKYLRHTANIIVYLGRKSEKNHLVSAFLRKHPNRPPRKVDFALSLGGEITGRITRPFRTLLQEQIDELKRSYREALMDASRRDAFDSLMRAWSSEQGAMSYAKVPTVLDVMLLTAATDNRKLIENLLDQINLMQSKLDKICANTESM